MSTATIVASLALLVAAVLIGVAYYRSTRPSPPLPPIARGGQQGGGPDDTTPRPPTNQT